MEQKLIRTFTAISEDGHEFEIYEYQNFIRDRDLDGQEHIVHTTKVLLTYDGDEVNRIEKGKYEIVDLDIIVTSDSPDAP